MPQLGINNHVFASDTGNFFVNNIIFEIGGKNKTRKHKYSEKINSNPRQ